jgi:hypothetical protein
MHHTPFRVGQGLGFPLFFLLHQGILRLLSDQETNPLCGIIVHLKAGSTTGRDLNHIRFTERTRPKYSRWLGNVSSFSFPKVSSNVDVASHADFCNLWTQVLMVEGR